MGDDKPDRNPYAVFISHASDERGHGEELAHHLEAVGHRCWIAPRDVRPGQEYAEEIVRGIEISRCFVLLLSESANNSAFVRREVERAANKGKPIFPLRLSDVPPSPGLELFISNVQWIDARDKNWEHHAARLAGLLEGGPTPTPFPKAKSSLRVWGWRTLRTLVYSLIGLSILTLDIMGFDKATERYSQNVFYNIIASKYGEEPFAAAGGARAGAAKEMPRWNEHISVILLDDDALKDGDRSNIQAGGISWPAPLAYHVKLLSDLYDNYRPKVIMVDLLFFDRRDGDKKALGDFIQLLTRIKREGRSRLFLAARDPSPERTEIIRELADAAELVAITWPDSAKLGGDPLFYPLAEGAGYSGEGGYGGFASGAAFTIYRSLCATDDTKLRPAMKCPDRASFDRYFGRPMQVFWGAKAPGLNWEQANLGIFCSAQDPSTPGRILKFLSASIVGSSVANRQTCPYAQVIKARDFMDPKFRAEPDVKAAFDAALKQKPGDVPKVVFYGVHFRGVEDFVETPTHGKVPGVFVHAMALDNLLTLGDQYIRKAKKFDPTLFVLKWCLAFLVAATAVLGRDVQTLLSQRGASRYWPIAVFAGSFLVGGIIIVTAVYAAFFWGRLAPINWLGFFGIKGVIWMVQAKRVENTTRKFMSLMHRRLSRLTN